MVLVQASKLSLSHSSHSPQISSLLFEPTSLSLALMHSDSSISLYPYLSSLPSSSLHLPPQTLTHDPSPSSSTFLLLRQSQNPDPDCISTNESRPRVLFVVAGPARGGSRVLLRFYALRSDCKGFIRARVVCNQKGIDFDRKLGVFLDLSHGVSIRIVGSINYFAVYSVSSSKIWVLGVKSIENGDGDCETAVVKLMRCAVIECSRPLWSMCLSFGLLILGEDNGVRVLHLRELFKGKVKNFKTSSSLNGKPEAKAPRLRNNANGGRSASCNGDSDGGTENHSVSVKQRTVKYKQESHEAAISFVIFNKEVDDSKSRKELLMPAKAISIQALSRKKFLILDSAGDLHVLRLSNSPTESSITCLMRQLPRLMKVQKLAVLPDDSADTFIRKLAESMHRFARNLTVIELLSNEEVNHSGSFSLLFQKTQKMVSLLDGDTAVSDNDDKVEDMLMQISVTQVIFSPEKIQDVVPMAGTDILVLGQGNIYAYAFS